MKNQISYIAFLIVFLLNAHVFNLQAQNGPPKHWDKTLGGNAWDNLTAMQQTSDGGYILCGWTDSGQNGDKSEISRGGRDYWIVKITAFGGKQWDRTYGGANPGNYSVDEATQVLQLADGSYIIGGHSAAGISGDKTESSRGGHDYWVLKLDPAGNKIWDKVFGGSVGENLTAMQQTADGNIILGGYSNSGFTSEKTSWGNGGYDYWLVKIDVNGNKLWDKSYGKSGNDFLASLHQTSDGGFILGGYTESQPIMGLSDYWIIKIDAAGTFQWDKVFTGDGEDVLQVIRQTSDGGYIIGGTSDSNQFGDKGANSKGSDDYWVMKTDSAGNKIWDKTLGGIGGDRLADLQQTTDGGFIIGGTADSNISGDKTQIWPGYWILKLNNAGLTQWDRSLTGSFGMGTLSCVKQTTDGGYIVGGYSTSNVGYDKSEPSRGNQDYWVVKLAPEILGINKAQTDLNFTLYPNPGNGTFSLEIPTVFKGNYQLEIQNIVGKTVAKQTLKVTDKDVHQLNLEYLPKGVYLLRIYNGEMALVKKLIID